MGGRASRTKNLICAEPNRGHREDCRCCGQLRRRVSPHPGPLPGGEGEFFAARWKIEHARLFSKRRALPPLLGGEGWGEGERIVSLPNRPYPLHRACACGAASATRRTTPVRGS